MKRIIYIVLGCMLISISPLKAQKQSIADPDKMWTVPAIYTMDEEITWYFDFASSSVLDDKDELFMWTWQPSEPGVPIPLKNEGNMMWSLTFVPTELYKKTVEEILNHEHPFYFNLRNEDVSKESGTLSIPIVDFISDFIATGNTIEHGPSDFTETSVLSILFNSNKVDGFNPVPHTVHMHGGLNGWAGPNQEFNAWLPDIREKTQFKHLGNGIYKKDFVPRTYFGMTDEDYMETIDFVIAKYDGADGWAGSTGDFRIVAPGIEYVPPVFTLFPIRMSKNDIMVINRTNNDRGQRLSYTVTGGDKTINGNLEPTNIDLGLMPEQRAYVNIAGEFGSKNISKINVIVKDQNDRVIFEGDIQFAESDNLTK